MTEVAERAERRTQEQWDELARAEIIPALQSGVKLKDVAATYAKGYTNAIRKTLTRLGYDTKGQPLEIEAIEASRPDRLASKVATARKAGKSWRELEQATGQSTAQLKELLGQYGHGELTHGRSGGTAEES